MLPAERRAAYDVAAALVGVLLGALVALGMAIVMAGRVLGRILLLAWNIIRDSQQQPSWDNLTLVVPWLNLAIIYVAVYAVAIAATLVPASRAARIRPAEALRYQ